MLGNSAIQRKKSLPDVAALPTVTVKQGSQAMTREEISVLSSARREEIRRQLEEAERYRANPVLYILNPHIRVSDVRVTQCLQTQYTTSLSLPGNYFIKMKTFVCYLAIVDVFYHHSFIIDFT